MALPQLKTESTMGSARQFLGSSTSKSGILKSIKTMTASIKKDMQEEPFLEAKITQGLENLEDAVQDNKVITEDISSIAEQQNDVLTDLLEDLKHMEHDYTSRTGGGPQIDLSRPDRRQSRRQRRVSRPNVGGARPKPTTFRKLTGFAVRGGGAALRFGARVARGVAGIVGGMALDYASQTATGAGYTKTGAALDVASSALSGAGIGATIGSVIPVVGTTVGAAVGGVVGGAVGAYQNWNNLTGTQPQAGAQRQQYQYSSDITPDTAKILATIKQRESGNYTETARGSSASGAYQFIDSTWQDLTKKYGMGQEFQRAKDAPPQVQDAVAAAYVNDILRANNGDVSKVPLVWYTGNAQGKMSDAAIASNNGQIGRAHV